MQKEPIPLETVLALAKEACKYARSIIIKGSTQLENNVLDELRFKSLDSAVHGDVRSLGIRDLSQITQQNLKKSDRLVNPIAASFDADLVIINKFSLGNCYELTLIALDYFIQNNIDISAEVFYIQGGDHVFLVLNRLPNSEANDPLTWGDKAVICDPWANKVFEAKYYKETLKNFVYDGFLNDIEDLKSHHKLTPIKNYSLDFLKEARSVKYVIETFDEEAMRLIQALQIYQHELSQEWERLKQKYTSFDEKILILSDKIKEAELMYKESWTLMKTSILSVRKNNNNYYEAKHYLNATLDTLEKNIVETMQFTQSDLKKLHAHDDNLYGDALKLFGIKSDTGKALKDLEKNINESIKRKK